METERMLVPEEPENLRRYLGYLLRMIEYIPGEVCEYFQVYTQKWHDEVSTEGHGMLIEAFLDLYVSKPDWIDDVTHRVLLEKAEFSAGKLLGYQYPISDPDPNRRGGFVIHPRSNEEEKVYVWGTAPDISALAKLYKLTGKEIYREHMKWAALWLLKAEEPKRSGQFREYYNCVKRSWGSPMDSLSAATRALFDAWSVTGNKKFHEAAVRAANRLVDVGSPPDWWGWSHLSLYAARDGLLYAYLYTRNSMYLNKAIEYADALPQEDFDINYMEAQAAYLYAMLYNITGETVWLEKYNYFAKLLWDETYVNSGSEGDHGIRSGDREISPFGVVLSGDRGSLCSSPVFWWLQAWVWRHIGKPSLEISSAVLKI